MKVILDEKWTIQLSRQPESGMGYQIATITFNNGETAENIYIYNGQVCDLPHGKKAEDIKSIQVKG